MQNRIFGILALIFFINIASEAQAISRSSGRRISGCVESIDSTTRMIVIKVDSEGCDGRRVEVKWSDRTRGELDGRAALLENLRAGTRVTARYISPVFGPPVLRAIRWCDSDVGSRFCDKR